METIESIKQLCTENGRAVPQPRKWADLYQLLKNRCQLPDGGWEPGLPLILGAWWSTIPLEKILRFQEHIEWAAKEGQLDEIGAYLRSLDENDWCHFGELPD